MPIYEFYCSACHTLFNFFSSKIDTTSRPPCPRCEQPDLEKRPARFATLKHAGDEAPDPFGDLDEDRLAGVMESMMGEIEGLEENEDPRQLAGLFRRFGEASGLEFGPRMEEMMSRLEAGEDPDRLEEEMGDDFSEDEAFEEFFRLRRSAWKSERRPQVDEKLYFL
jgi:putative FmdB family regulatory protein